MPNNIKIDNNDIAIVDNNLWALSVYFIFFCFVSAKIVKLSIPPNKTPLVETKGVNKKNMIAMRDYEDREIK